MADRRLQVQVHPGVRSPQGCHIPGSRTYRLRSDFPAQIGAYRSSFGVRSAATVRRSTVLGEHRLGWRSVSGTPEPHPVTVESIDETYDLRWLDDHTLVFDRVADVASYIQAVAHLESRCSALIEGAENS